MGQERGQTTVEDRAVRRLLEKIEQGHETIIKRVQSTLGIDSETHPTEDDIREFFKIRSAGKENARKQNRGSQ